MGNEIIKLLLENYASVINLDIVDKKRFDQKISKKLQFSKFDISDLENLDKNIEHITKNLVAQIFL